MSEGVSVPTGWQEIKIAGVPCACPSVKEPTAERGLVVLPDHAGMVLEISQLEQAIVQHNVEIVLPLVRHCWWSDRPTENFPAGMSAMAWLRQQLRPWLVSRLPSAAPPPALLGIEAGGQGALRLAYRFPDEFPVVAAIRPAIDFHTCLRTRSENAAFRHSVACLYDSEESARQDTATLHIHPLNWPRHQWFCCGGDSTWWDGAERLRMKLHSLGVMHECELHTDRGDDCQYDATMMPRAIAFVIERLEQERRRL